MRFLKLIAAGALLTACGSGPDAAPADAPADEQAAEGPTAADLAGYDELVHGFQPWDTAYAALVEAWGEPTRTEGDAVWWYAPHGERCVAFRLQDMGGAVGARELTEGVDCP